MKVMEAGEIAQSGKYDTLLTQGRGFKQLVDAHQDAMGGVNLHDQQQHDETTNSIDVNVPSEPQNLNKSSSRGETMLRHLR